MKKRYYISRTDAAGSGEQPNPDFAVLFATKYYWRGRFRPEDKKYSYENFPAESPPPDSDLEEVDEEIFFQRLGRKAIAVRQFLKAYSNYLEKLERKK